MIGSGTSDAARRRSRASSNTIFERGQCLQGLTRRAWQNDSDAAIRFAQLQSVERDRNEAPSNAEKAANLKHRKQRVVFLIDDEVFEGADAFVSVVQKQPAWRDGQRRALIGSQSRYSELTGVKARLRSSWLHFDPRCWTRAVASKVCSRWRNLHHDRQAGVLCKESGRKLLWRTINRANNPLIRWRRRWRKASLPAIQARRDSSSRFARGKAEGEDAVLSELPTGVVLRPSLMFRPEDRLFNRFAAMGRMSPALPLIGGARTNFQPVYVGDVCRSCVRRQGTSAYDL